MKKITVVLFAGVLMLLACQKNTGSPVEKKIDWDKASIAIMDSMRPKLLANWKMKSVSVKPSAPSTSEIGIYKDTVLYNFAELNLTQVKNSGYYEKGNDVTGVITFRSKRYPVGFRLHAHPDRVVHKKGPQVFGLVEYRFPVGTHLTELEESYLSNLTLIGDNFEIEISADGRSMTWKGLNRAIKNISFEKY
ncbi:hypothetical protein [Pedobacter heparinus]|uniref:hypothetical protein n=1 Tax=Pedobacter heparinus TaxID=984 RepID=UPI00292E3714|nr:hypothetical protein [Pedobacter heparinus]